MGAILNRYVFRETLQTWLVVTGILLLILLTDQFARVLDDVAEADIPKDAIVAVMGLSILQYLTILIPVGIFIAILLSLARLYRDSEMAAMMACGIGNTALYRPIVFLALLLACLVAWLSLVAGPSAAREVERIEDEAKRSADLGLLEPGRFISFGRDETTIYAEEVTEGGVLKNVFVQRRQNDKVVVIVAAEASQQNEVEAGQKILFFKNGERHEGVPGDKAFRVVKFAEHGIPFEVSGSREPKIREETLTVTELFELNTPTSVAEFQWRLSVPLTLLLLTLIAVPLSRSPPRTGRYNNLIAGILIYVMYSNMLGASKVWIEQEKIPSWLGMWWVHGIMLVVTLFMLLRHNNVFIRMFRKQSVAATT
ncbi:MAG: LPS export ABC transporter permease LptF [Gammaproteobacteria bacterium]